MKFFNDITDNDIDDTFTILEIIGLVASNVKCSKFKKLLILKGAGDTGKSKLREFVATLIGEENCYTIDLNQMHSKFGLGGIYGKRLVGCGDMQFSRIPEIDISKCVQCKV